MKEKFNIWRVLAIVLVVIIAVAGIAWYQGFFQRLGMYRPANSIMVIMPYRYAGTWVFDDARLGLQREAFVAGIPEMMDDMVKDFPGADKGFRLTFSAKPFPGYSHKLTWRRGDQSGNWYYCDKYDKEGWLCPGLFKYYKDAPKEIYVKADKR